VIADLGIALSKQIDRNEKIYNNPEVGNDIYSKLRELGLEKNNKDLFDKHMHLNDFFNATKHGKKEYNKKCEDILNTPKGREITIDYFETERRIFRWYYKKYNKGDIPDWDALKSIKYSGYGIKYQFLYKTRWIENAQTQRNAEKA